MIRKSTRSLGKGCRVEALLREEFVGWLDARFFCSKRLGFSEPVTNYGCQVSSYDNSTKKDKLLSSDSAKLSNTLGYIGKDSVIFKNFCFSRFSCLKFGRGRVSINFMYISSSGKSCVASCA
jgi:hypothetical protein